MEGWKGGLSKKGPSGDVVDRLISNGERVDFQKRAQAEMMMTYVDRLISKGGRVDFQKRAKRRCR